MDQTGTVEHVEITVVNMAIQIRIGVFSTLLNQNAPNNAPRYAPKTHMHIHY
jgi:hypothetical protein